MSSAASTLSSDLEGHAFATGKCLLAKMANRTSNRRAFWQNSLEMVKEKPLIGVGPGQWQIHFH